MTGMLDPVGPEEARTYWVRRGVVAAALLIVVVLVVIAVTSLNGGGASQGTPTVPSGPSLQPASATPVPPTDQSASPASPAPTDGASPSAPASPTAPSQTPSSAAPPASSSAAPPSSPAAPAACDPKVLRSTLVGPRDVRVGTPVTFEAGFTNGGTAACTLTLDPQNYEFRIYSGTDRIWTTRDCAQWLPKVSTVLEPEKAVTWKIDWSVQRSKDCSLTKDVLRPGTYAANSLLSGADPAQLVMQVRS